MGRLTSSPRPPRDRAGWIPYVTSRSAAAFGADWTGYEAAISPEVLPTHISVPCISEIPNLDYLGDEDVVECHPDGTVQVLYRRASEHNSILVTEQCNSYCLMCSQPPRQVDDRFRIEKISRLLELISAETREIGFTGGEPTLMGEGFLEIVQKARHALPYTALHILTNGRKFKDAAFAQRLAVVGHPDMMLGIPLYSDVDWRHDYVVQAEGAFNETIEGLYHLAQFGIRVELRIVLHKQTVERLPRLATFIVRNLPFVEHVALMGLEMFGFTLPNLTDVWIDPVDYSPQLLEATRILALGGQRPLIFNHQLCTIPNALWPFAVKSISDWKNTYLPECDNCGVRGECGGFFQSATKRHSAYIRPVTDPGNVVLG